MTPNTPGTYDGKPITELSDKCLALARDDVVAAIARVQASPNRGDRAEYEARMVALLPEIEAEIERRI